METGSGYLCKICHLRFVDSTAHHFHEKWSHQFEVQNMSECDVKVNQLISDVSNVYQVDDSYPCSEKNVLDLMDTPCTIDVDLNKQSVLDVEQVVDLETVKCEPTIDQNNKIDNNTAKDVSNENLIKLFEDLNDITCVQNSDLNKQLDNIHSEKAVTKVDQKFCTESDQVNLKSSQYIDCQGTFISSSKHLKKHTISVHKLMTLHSCKLCQKSFSRNGCLQIHFMSVHEGLKPHDCHICQKSFAHKHHLKKHVISVHNKLKPHNCQVCQKSFLQSNELQKHVMSVHEKLKPHNCKVCQKGFSRKYLLHLHVKSVHEELKPNK